MMRMGNFRHQAPPAFIRIRPEAEGLVREAVLSEEPGARLAAIEGLGGDMGALLTVAVRSFHKDSAEAARKAYFEALAASESAIVNRCMAILSPEPERRAKSVAALAGWPEELRLVATGCPHRETREMAMELLRDCQR